jgi:hypothetical protein
MTVFALKEGLRTQMIDLGNGLIMRWSSRDDADNVGDLLAEAFRVMNLPFNKCTARRLDWYPKR